MRRSYHDGRARVERPPSYDLRVKRPADLVRSLLTRERNAVLSTIERGSGGQPFGSLAPFALSPAGDPVFLFSTISEHAKNLASDPRASLFVADSRARANPQAGARVTLLGRVAAPPPRAVRAERDAYLARFPEAEEYLSAHRFRIFVLAVERVRWIAGFGSMGWIAREELLSAEQL